MGAVADILAIARPTLLLLRTAEGWLTWRAGLLITSLLACFPPMYPLLGWYSEPVPRAPLNLFAIIVIYAGVWFVVLMAWLFTRSLYWRSGRGTRVAISFSPHQVDSNDLYVVRRTLDRLGRSFDCGTRISFRAFPLHASSVSADQRRIAKKYSFDLYLRVSVSPLKSDSSRYCYSAEAFVASQRLSDKYRDSIKRLVENLGLEPSGSSSTLNDLRRKAEWLHEAILSTLGMVAVCEGKHADAANILDLLDTLIATRLKPDDPLRAYIRYTCCMCLMKASEYAGTGARRYRLASDSH